MWKEEGLSPHLQGSSQCLQPGGGPLNGYPFIAASWTSHRFFLKQFTSFNINQPTFIPKRLISSKKYTPVKTSPRRTRAGATGNLGHIPQD